MTWSGRRSLAGIVACAALGVASPAAASGAAAHAGPERDRAAAGHRDLVSVRRRRPQLVPEDLRKVGYVEEEYLVSGKANVYSWPAPGPAVVRTPNAPYTTRILVRRPAKASRFSGNVVVEMLNPSNRVRPQHRLGDGAPPDGPQRRRLGRASPTSRSTSWR